MNGCGASGIAPQRKSTNQRTIMRTRKFKTLRGWLNFLNQRRPRTSAKGNPEIFEPLDEFFKEERHFAYFSNVFKANEKWHSENVILPWEEKYPVALAIVNYHWKSRTKSDRERIATNLAKGYGDLSFLQCFAVSMERVNGKWQYVFCSNGLSGPSYDYCKREYVRSI